MTWVQVQGETGWGEEGSGQGAPDPRISVVPVASSGLVFRHREGFIISLESVLNHAVLLSSFTVPSSPTQDTSLRSFFDPSSQHRDWCPWVNTVEGGEALEDTTTQTEKEPVKAEPGWRVVLNTLLATRKCDRVPETEPVVSLAGSPAPKPSTQNTACPGLARGRKSVGRIWGRWASFGLNANPAGWQGPNVSAESQLPLWLC